MLGLPKNIYIMSLVMSLCFITTAMLVLIAGLLGASIAPKPELATLPLAMAVVGTALATIPAAMTMQKFGRKLGMAIGIGIAMLGAVLAYFAAMTSHFWLFVLGSTCLGINAAFIQQGRFIILENAIDEQQQADGLSLALMANLAAAVVGPQLGAYGRDLVASPAGFAGSFILAAGVLVLALMALTQFNNQTSQPPKEEPKQRPLKLVIRQPLFIMAAGSAAVGYGVMALVMTATPISMHEMNGHSLQHTTLVIQSHIVAMFLPSLLTAKLLKMGYRVSLLVLGLALYAIVSAIGFTGAQVIHYWWALVLLGLGWNLLFVTSTTLLQGAHSHHEKFKAQAANDFLVFSMQATGAFAAGWLLFSLGWRSVLWIALIASVTWAVYLLILQRKIST